MADTSVPHPMNLDLTTALLKSYEQVAMVNNKTYVY